MRFAFVKPLFLAKAFLESFNATACVNNFLFASEKWVAFVANINFDDIFFNTRACFESVSARALNRNFVVFWLNAVLH